MCNALTSINIAVYALLTIPLNDCGLLFSGLHCTMPPLKWEEAASSTRNNRRVVTENKAAILEDCI